MSHHVLRGKLRDAVWTRPMLTTFSYYVSGHFAILCMLCYLRISASPPLLSFMLPPCGCCGSLTSSLSRPHTRSVWRAACCMVLHWKAGGIGRAFYRVPLGLGSPRLPVPQFGQLLLRCHRSAVRRALQRAFVLLLLLMVAAKMAHQHILLVTPGVSLGGMAFSARHAVEHICLLAAGSAELKGLKKVTLSSVA